MEPRTWTHKHDLLYMYLCLGYLSGNKLQEENFREIFTRFEKWLPDITPGESLQIKDEVINKYEGLSDFQGRYDQYLQSAFSLKAFLKGEGTKLISIMIDLIAIADVDQKAAREETALIMAAIKAWWLDLDPRKDAVSDVLNGSTKIDPSLSNKATSIKGWNSAHDLLYMFVCMGHLPDHQFSNGEVMAIMNIWKRRYPSMKSEEFQNIRSSVMERYNQFDSDDERYHQFLISASALKTSGLGKNKNLVAILKDLLTLARADRHILENEVTMIEGVAKIWDLKVELVAEHGKNTRLIVL